MRQSQEEAFVNMGDDFKLALALETAGRSDEAIVCYRRVLEHNPLHLEAWHKLAYLLKTMGQLDEAVLCYRRVLHLKPDFALAYSNLGNVLSDQGKQAEAVSCYEHALRLLPDFAAGHYNLGNAHALQGQFDTAIVCFQEALRLRPTFVAAIVETANAHRAIGRLDEALAGFDLALRLKPTDILAQWNRALLLLLRGDFERGWPAYESRWAQHPLDRRQFLQPLWDGSDLGGRSILLYAEQGLGDTLQFLRFVPMVRQRCGKVILEVSGPAPPPAGRLPRNR
jgi:tetratricopeptide (TPR) repeat protein